MRPDGQYSNIGLMTVGGMADLDQVLKEISLLLCPRIAPKHGVLGPKARF